MSRAERRLTDAADEVAEAEKALARAKAKRARAVSAAIESGLSVRAVARLAGLSPQQVQNIRHGDPTGSRYTER